MRPAVVRAVLLACLLAAVSTVWAASPARAATPAPAPARHVVVVGLSGLRWSEVSPAATPTLWRLAAQGSVGSLVDYAVLPLTCPADGWLTLGAGARAQSEHTNAACGGFPAVVAAHGGAEVPGLGALESYNQRFHDNPDWGLLAGAAGCATAVGPGAALALADRAGHVASYLPLGGRPHRRGAVPLPADRRGPGKSRIYRTGIGACRRGLRTRPHRGGTARRHDLAGHRPRCHDQAAAPAAGPGQRTRLPGRPARRQLDAAAGAGRAHRPDPDRARLARPARPGRRRRRAAHPRRPGRAGPDDQVPDRPGHGRAGVAVDAQRVLLGLRAGRRARAGRDRAGVLGRGAGTAPAAGAVVAGGRGVRRRGARRHLPGQPGAVVAVRPSRGVAVRDGRGLGAGHRGGRAGRAVAS